MAEVRQGGTTQQIKSGVLVTYEITYSNESETTHWNATIRWAGRGPHTMAGGQVTNVNSETRAQAIRLAFGAELETLDLQQLGA